MTSKLREALIKLHISLGADIQGLSNPTHPMHRRLAWIGSELERLAGEAYRLADELDNDPCREPIPGFDE